MLLTSKDSDVNKKNIGNGPAQARRTDPENRMADTYARIPLNISILTFKHGES